jgi:hypothetical protein
MLLDPVAVDVFCSVPTLDENATAKESDRIEKARQNSASRENIRSRILRSFFNAFTFQKYWRSVSLLLQSPVVV